MVRFFSASTTVQAPPPSAGALSAHGTKLAYQTGVSTLQLSHLAVTFPPQTAHGAATISVLLKVQGPDDAVPRVVQLAHFKPAHSPVLRLDQRFTVEKVELLAIAHGLAAIGGSVLVTGAVVLNDDETS